MLPYFKGIKRYVINPTCENFGSFRFFFYSKNAFSIFVLILMDLIGSYFTNYSKTITHQAEIFQ